VRRSRGAGLNRSSQRATGSVSRIAGNSLGSKVGGPCPCRDACAAIAPSRTFRRKEVAGLAPWWGAETGGSSPSAASAQTTRRALVPTPLGRPPSCYTCARGPGLPRVPAGGPAGGTVRFWPAPDDAPGKSVELCVVGPGNPNFGAMGSRQDLPGRHFHRRAPPRPSTGPSETSPDALFRFHLLFKTPPKGSLRTRRNKSNRGLTRGLI
jgi:hypothetical protein